MYSSMAAGKVSSSKMQLGNSSRKELSSPLLPVSIYDVHGSLSCANVYLPQPCVSLLRTARCSKLQGEDTHTHTHLGCVVAAKRPSYLNPLSFPCFGQRPSPHGISHSFRRKTNKEDKIYYFTLHVNKHQPRSGWKSLLPFPLRANGCTHRKNGW